LKFYQDIEFENTTE